MVIRIIIQTIRLVNGSEEIEIDFNQEVTADGLLGLSFGVPQALVVANESFKRQSLLKSDLALRTRVSISD